MKFLRHRRAADHVASLQDRDLQPRLREIRGAYEPVMAGANDNDVAHRALNPTRVSAIHRAAVSAVMSATSRLGSNSVRSTLRTLGCPPISQAASKKSCTGMPPGRAPGA